MLSAIISCRSFIDFDNVMPNTILKCTTGQLLCVTSSRASALASGFSLTCYLSCPHEGPSWLINHNVFKIVH